MAKAGISLSECIVMVGGLPNDKLFPFQSVNVKLRDGGEFDLQGAAMAEALQYGPSTGYPPLVAKVKELLKEYHNPPKLGKPHEEGGLDVCILPGSQDAIAKSMEMMLSRGDNIILENPTYTGALGVVQPLGINMLSVATDKDGIIPGELLKVMSPWKPSDAKNPQSDIPKVMYIIPNGGNPSGATISGSRRTEIYDIAREYDMLIVEDDPYYFIQFEDKPPSFLSMDVDGRVIRLDSFSKVMSSGIRVGVASGPEPLIRRLMFHHMVSSQHASTLSQVLVYQLLNKWGLEGFKKHTVNCQAFYRKQKDAIHASATKYLGDLAEWVEPRGGMFLWIKINGITDTRPIADKLVSKRILVAAGFCFTTNHEAPSPYIRVSYSFVTQEQMDMAFHALREIILEELKSNKA